MSSYRYWVFGGLLLLLLGGALAIWNAEKNVRPPATIPSASGKKEDGMVGRGVSFVVTEGELKKWKMTAVKAVYNPEHTDAELTGVRGEFYNAKGEPVLQFTSERGNYINKNHAVELTGSVVASSIDTGDKPANAPQGRLEAPRMLWDAKTNWITATGGVMLHFPHGKSVAQSCRFNLDFSKISLQGNVASTVSP